MPDMEGCLGAVGCWVGNTVVGGPRPESEVDTTHTNFAEGLLLHHSVLSVVP